MNRLVNYVVAVAGLIVASSVMASGGSGPKVAEGVNYIALEPALVVNYGGPGKSRFIKAELSIRTETGEAALEVYHHLPLIRDRLVSILGDQTEEIISTVEGKEYLRAYALAEINKALLKVTGHYVDDHDAKHSAGEKKPGGKPAHTEIKQPEQDTQAAPAPTVPSITVPSIADIKPVKGPASDLYFNNFVVQK